MRPPPPQVPGGPHSLHTLTAPPGRHRPVVTVVTVVTISSEAAGPTRQSLGFGVRFTSSTTVGDYEFSQGFISFPFKVQIAVRYLGCVVGGILPPNIMGRNPGQMLKFPGPWNVASCGNKLVSSSYM